MPPHSLRPVGAKVKINRSPILLPLQGVGVYALIPWAPAWAVNWLPFQGAPFRALFVYHVRMLRRHIIWLKKKRAVATDSRTRPSILSTRHRSACASRLADLGSSSPLWDRRGGNCA